MQIKAFSIRTSNHLKVNKPVVFFLISLKMFFSVELVPYKEAKSPAPQPPVHEYTFPLLPITI